MIKILNFSPNFSKKNRKISEIKFVIIHYTGMQSEIESIKRLKNPKFKVSCHYLISKRGNIFQLVKDENVAWHAGKSKWLSDLNLNLKSIGIELVNNGNEPFAKKQINSLIKLLKFLKKNILKLLMCEILLMYMIKLLNLQKKIIFQFQN